MTKLYKPLHTVPLKKTCKHVRSPKLPELVHLDDPAVYSLIDFQAIPIPTIKGNKSLTELRTDIKSCAANAFLVTNGDEKIIGFISSEDIFGEKSVKTLQESHLSPNDIIASHLMIEIEKMLGLDIYDLQFAKVANIIETLKAAKQHYALVVSVNADTEQQCIRGLFSLSSISKQLRMNVLDDDLYARSLAELQHSWG